MTTQSALVDSFLTSTGVTFAVDHNSFCFWPGDIMPSELAKLPQTELKRLAELTKSKRVTLHDAGGNETLKLCRPAWECDLAGKLRQKLTCTLSRNGNTVSFDFYRHHSHEKQPLSTIELLYCVALDADAMNDTFDGWCENFGFDSDSIKALSTYNACVDSGRKLAKIFSPVELDQLRNLIQDY